MLRMNRLLALTLGAALAATACGTASDATDSALSAPDDKATAAASDNVTAGGDTKKAPAAARVTYRDVTLPSGTTLPLSLTSSMASDTSAVEDPITAELSRAITVDGHEVLPAGTP